MSIKNRGDFLAIYNLSVAKMFKILAQGFKGMTWALISRNGKGCSKFFSEQNFVIKKLARFMSLTKAIY